MTSEPLLEAHGFSFLWGFLLLVVIMGSSRLPSQPLPSPHSEYCGSQEQTVTPSLGFLAWSVNCGRQLGDLGQSLLVSGLQVSQISSQDPLLT